MKEPIEQFILTHRADLDTLEPNSESWDRIQEHLKPPTTTRFWYWKTAAVVLISFALGLLLKDQLFTPQVASQHVDPVFLQQEIQYIQAIESQKKVLKSMDIEAKNQDLMEEEAILSATYQNLKAQYLRNPDDDRIRESLLQNLRLRGIILMEQIELLKSLDTNENDPSISNS